MAQRTWLITGVSSGFGRQLTERLLDGGERVVGTVRGLDKVADLVEQYPAAFRAELLDVTDAAAIREVVDRSFAELGRIDVIVSNAGYSLFGATEELSDEQIRHIVDTNLIGSIQLIRAALPHLRRQGGGRIIQISSYGGQVAFPGNSMYHATKWGIEGFVESVAQEVAPFGIGMTIVEPGGARTQFRFGSAQVAEQMPVYDDTPARAPLRILDPANGLAPGDPAPDGSRDHLERRPGTRAAAHDPRIRRAQEHPQGASRPDRRLRGADGARRVNRLPTRPVTHVECHHAPHN